jgi:hypothetical protein
VTTDDDPTPAPTETTESVAARLASVDSAARDVATLRRLVNAPVSTAGTRAAAAAATAARTRQLLDTYPGAAVAAGAEAAPWLLVEHNIHPAGDASRWVTGHATAAAAATYHRDQESAEDWTVVELVDVENDHRWDGESHPAWSRGIGFPALLDQLVDAAGRRDSDQVARLVHQTLLTYGEAVTTVEETTEALAGAESAAAARDLYTLLAQPAPPNFPGPLVDLSAVGANTLVPIPAVPAAEPIRIRTWDEAAVATADLPPGSIVAGRNDVYVREDNPDTGVGVGGWRITRNSYVYDDLHVDHVRRRGGRVIRHGYDGVRGALPVAPSAARLRDLLDALLAAAAEPEFDPGTSVRDEIVARYAAHEADPGPSRDQLTDMLDAVDDEEADDDDGYPGGWHAAVAAIRNLIDRYPDGLRTPHPDAGQPFRGPDGKIMDGFVVAICGHRVAGMEWRAGMTTCERDSKDEFRRPAAVDA